jgi:hypothetical protein
MTQDNVLYAFVAKDAQTSEVTGALSGLSSGEIGVYDMATNLLVTNTAAGDTYKIVANVGGVYQYSPEIVYNDILSSSHDEYAADTEYTGYLGYNGTNGDIDATADTIYTPKLVVKGIMTTFGNKSMMKEGVYKTANVTTVYKSDVAIGLTGNFIKNMSKEPEEYVEISALCSAAVTTDNGLDYAATVVIGTKTVTIATAITYDTGTDIVVGDFIRVGSVAGGTALSDNVYEVKSISSLVITLDRDILEASGTYAAGTYDVEVIPLATAQTSGTKFGLKFAGQARTNFEAGLWRDMVYDFQILRGANFDDVLITETASVLGTNTYNEVTELQWFAQGNRGYGYRVDCIPVASQVTTETGVDYISVGALTHHIKSLDLSLKAI